MTCKSFFIAMLLLPVSFTVEASKSEYLKRYVAIKAAWLPYPSANLSGKDLANANGAGEDIVEEPDGHKSLVMNSIAVAGQLSSLETAIQLVTGKKEMSEEIRFGQNIRLQRKSVAIPIGQQRKLSQTGIRLSWHFGR